ncbi:uncharacterized protein Hap1MRO34_002699 isoform 2-T2 [Clarias gariepinus]|uniref:histone-lysine N-methyltransferase PRDM9-like isoform X2 n=1 Tax=Clarias gariepinus TaxID=13013 RepID=UPI00234D17A9|nr:histone-lysine N-methyltransferase PRDM9-like isoform X2 [Clarias gariepinus]
MTSAEASLSCTMPPVTPAQSLCKALQTETSLTSARGSVRHFNSYGQINGGFEKKPIKEEPEDEDFSCGKISNSERHISYVDQQIEEFHELFLKEEPEVGNDVCGETSSCIVHVNLVDEEKEFQEKLLKEEEPKEDDFLYCEYCRSFFINKCEIHGPALFLPDTPVPKGVSDRARQTLPPGLEVQESCIPKAGLGVFNRGDTVPVGAHYGPYQGDLVDKEEGMTSIYSWVIYNSRHFEKYIDAKRVTHANWMRYVNCAHNSKESNLVAFQYQGEIFYRCHRSIKPRQELLVWYEEKYAKALGITFKFIWNKKCSISELSDYSVNYFSCSMCSLICTSQIDLHEHINMCHYEENISMQKLEQTKHKISNATAISANKQNQTGTCFVKTSDRMKEIYCCSECGKRFAGRFLLKQHLRIHTGERPFHCLQCGKRFARQSHLQAHQTIHTGEKLYACSECGKCFNRESTLQRHRLIHTGEKPYQCSECGKRFTYQNALKRHLRVHTGEKPYACSECGKRFNYHNALQRHQRVHTGEKPYICSECGKSFSQSISLQIHQLVHTGEKPYACLECGKVFLQQNTLQIHQRIHTGERPFRCGQCEKSFNQDSALQRHQRTHTGERPYRCSQCGKSFARQCHLKRHEHIHTGEKPYQCSQCGKHFNRESTLQRHQHTHTGQKLYICSECGKSFTRQSNLKIHQQVHTGEKQ